MVDERATPVIWLSFNTPSSHLLSPTFWCSHRFVSCFFDLFSSCHSQEEQNRGKPNWEHLNEDLHVLLTVEDTQSRAEIKMRRAVDEVKKLLVPAVSTLGICPSKALHHDIWLSTPAAPMASCLHPYTDHSNSSAVQLV